MNHIQINIPEGFEIDNDKSDFSKGIIEFKPVEEKKLSYEYIAKEMFENKFGYYFFGNKEVREMKFGESYNFPLNATSKEQLECLMAYNKLRNVAEYLNKGWKPNWNNSYDVKYYIVKYYIYYDHDIQKLVTWGVNRTQCSVYFASKELAEQAIEILGEEEIKKALFIY